MAFNNWEKFVEEYNKMNPGALPEDAATRMQSLTPPESPAINPDNYQVNISDDTVKMNGDPRSLPSFSPSTSVSDKQNLDYEIEQDTAIPPEPAVEKSAPIAEAPPAKETTMESIFPATDNDAATREAGLTALEKKRKLGIIPQLAAGFGDAVAAGVSAKGGNMPMGALESVMKRQDTDYESGKKDVEAKLRNDPNSDISKQYQELVARFLQKEPGDPALLGLTANQIAEKIPQIEKIATLRQQDDLKRAQIDANKESRLSREAMAREKQDAKTQALQDKKEGAINDAKAQAGIIRGTIKDIINRDLVGFDTAGPTGSKWIAPLDYPDLASKLDTIAGNIAFATMNKMRQNSPTGGALGNVSDKDMALLMSVKGSLKQEQSPAQLKETLKRLDELYTKVEGYDADITAPWKDPAASTPQARKSKGGHSYQVEP